MPFDGGYKAWRQAVSDGWTVAAEAARRANRGRPGATVVPAPSPSRLEGPARIGRDRAGAAVAVAPAPAPAPAAARPKRAKLSKEAYRRRSETLDAELSRLSLRRSQLELAMGTPAVTANFVELRRVTSELADVERALAEAENAWLELEEMAP